MAEELGKSLGEELRQELAAAKSLEEKTHLGGGYQQEGDSAALSADKEPAASRRHEEAQEEVDSLLKSLEIVSGEAAGAAAAPFAKEQAAGKEVKPAWEIEPGVNEKIETEIRNFYRIWEPIWEKFDRMGMGKPETRRLYEEAVAELDKLGINRINEEWWSWPQIKRENLLGNLKQAEDFLTEFSKEIKESEFQEAPEPVEDAEAGRIKAEQEDSAIAEALTKAEWEYVAAEASKIKAEKEEGKLTSLRSRIKEFFVSGFSSYETDRKRVPDRLEKIGGAQAEALAAKENFLKAKENLKTTVRQYRDREIAKIEARQDLTDKQKQDQAKEILLAATWREAARIEDLKAQQQIEQMGRSRRFINEKAEDFADWYKNLPSWRIKIPGTNRTVPISSQVLVSAGLFGAAIGGVALGSAAILTATFIGQVGLRSLGGAMTTAGVEGLFKKWSEKTGEKKVKEFFELDFEIGGNFLNTVRNLDDRLEENIFGMLKTRQKEKNRRMILAGLTGSLVGTGILASAVKEAIGFSGSRGVGRAPGAGIDSVKAPRPAGGVAAGSGTGGDVAAVRPGELAPLSPDEFDGGAEKNLKELASQSVASLEIGRRGPEGAIIDYFKGNKEMAARFGWDGQSNFSRWAGTKAHQLWLASVENELAKPEVIEKLRAGGFSTDAEGYAKAMRRIGRGFVRLSLDGQMSLSGDTAFLKAAAEKMIPGDVGADLPSSREDASAAPGETKAAAVPAGEKDVPAEKTAAPGEETAASAKEGAGPAGEAAEPAKEGAAGDLTAAPEPEASGKSGVENPLPVPEARRHFDLTEQRSAGEKAVDLAKSALPPDRLQIIKNLVSSSASANDLLKEIESGRISAQDFGQYYAEKAGASQLSPALMENLNKNFRALNGPEGIEKMNATRVITTILRSLKQ